MVCEGTIGPATEERTVASRAGFVRCVSVSSSHGALTVWISPPLSLPALTAEVVVRRTMARETLPAGRPLTLKRR